MIAMPREIGEWYIQVDVDNDNFVSDFQPFNKEDWDVIKYIDGEFGFTNLNSVFIYHNAGCYLARPLSSPLSEPIYILIFLVDIDPAERDKLPFWTTAYLTLQERRDIIGG